MGTATFYIFYNFGALVLSDKKCLKNRIYNFLHLRPETLVPGNSAIFHRPDFLFAVFVALDGAGAGAVGRGSGRGRSGPWRHRRWRPERRAGGCGWRVS